MDKKTLAILTYIDDTPNMVEEFGWLYKSWIYSGNWRTSTIIAVCNPAVISKLPQDPGVIFLPKEPMNVPGSRWADYKFINSIGCLVGKHTDYIPRSYTHALRTDADVFLAPSLIDFRPDFYAFGRGRYIQTAETRHLITDFAARHGLAHHGIFNCGHSILGPASGVLDFLTEQVRICELLMDDFGDDEGSWPRWSRWVSTMYAAELAANHRSHITFHAYLNMLDFEAYREDDLQSSHIMHIHAPQSKAYWSKFAYRAGDYKDMPTENLDRTRVNTYCHWIASTSIDDVKKACDYAY